VDTDRNLDIADYGDNRIRKVTKEGVISTTVGNGIRGYGADGGPATSAQLAGPRSLAVNSTGNDASIISVKTGIALKTSTNNFPR
jgi:hypothetical protein